MPKCSALNCKNHTGRNKKAGVSFHKFPRDEARLSEWLVKVKQEGFQPNVDSRLCSEHFTSDSFDRCGLRVQLLKNAVPIVLTEAPQRVIFIRTRTRSFRSSVQL